METKDHDKVTAERLSGGRFFRLMLRGVRPEHVADMIHTLWLFGHGNQKLTVPQEGRWVMGMPHDYVLVGQGRAGVVIEPAQGLVALRVTNPYSAHFPANGGPTVPVTKMDEHDTESVLALCDQARKTTRSERDRAISQIFVLNLDRCRSKALEAVELLIYDLIVNEAE